MPTNLPLVRRPNPAVRAARQSLIAAVVIAVLPVLLILIDAAVIGDGRISTSALLRAWVADGSTSGLIDDKKRGAFDPWP